MRSEALILCLLAGCAVPRALHRAEVSLEAGQHEAALSAFAAVTAAHPDQARALLGQARALEALGRPVEAAAVAARAYAVDPEEGVALHVRGLLATGRCEDARPLARGGWSALAELDCGDPARARALVPEATTGLGAWVAVRLGDPLPAGPDDPDRAAARVLAGEPAGTAPAGDAGATWLASARRRLQAGDREGALRYSHRALAAGVDGRPVAAKAWIALGEPARAVAVLEGSPHRALLVEAWVEAGEPGEAADALEDLLRDDGTTGAGLHRLADLLAAAGRLPEAARVLRASADHGDREAQLELARRSLHAGRPDHARHYAARVLAETPDDAEAQALLDAAAR